MPIRARDRVSFNDTIVYQFDGVWCNHSLVDKIELLFDLLDPRHDWSNDSDPDRAEIHGLYFFTKLLVQEQLSFEDATLLRCYTQLGFVKALRSAITNAQIIQTELTSIPNDTSDTTAYQQLELLVRHKLNPGQLISGTISPLKKLDQQAEIESALQALRQKLGKARFAKLKQATLKLSQSIRECDSRALQLRFNQLFIKRGTRVTDSIDINRKDDTDFDFITACRHQDAQPFALEYNAITTPDLANNLALIVGQQQALLTNYNQHYLKKLETFTVINTLLLLILPIICIALANVISGQLNLAYGMLGITVAALNYLREPAKPNWQRCCTDYETQSGSIAEQATNVAPAKPAMLREAEPKKVTSIQFQQQTAVLPAARAASSQQTGSTDS